MRIARKTMILLIAAAFAAEPECRQIHLAQDVTHSVKPPTGLPDVAATDKAMDVRTKEYAPLILDTKRGTGCLDFGDARAFEWAYQNAGKPDPFLMVTVNGTILADEESNSLFPARATGFYVHGLKTGDTVDVLVLAEGYRTPVRCRVVPTEDVETVCDRGYLLWERREYVY